MGLVTTLQSWLHNTFLFSIYFTVCTIKGQVIQECALNPNCTTTCNNTNEACVYSCIPYGCQCPNGTVVDEANNECIATSECPTVPPPKIIGE